jgi:hypothetical protein
MSLGTFCHRCVRAGHLCVGGVPHLPSILLSFLFFRGFRPRSIPRRGADPTPVRAGAEGPEKPDTFRFSRKTLGVVGRAIT